MSSVQRLGRRLGGACVMCDSVFVVGLLPNRQFVITFVKIVDFALSRRNLPEILDEIKCQGVDGVLLDLGFSSDQLDDPDRGFSFLSDGPLDLRFDPTSGKPAWQLINKLSENQIADLIYEFGEERFSRRIARRIVAQRKSQPLHTARELAELVRSCVPRSKKSTIDAATRTFQALRIFVNDELGRLEKALRILPQCLLPGGTLAIISFHSLEDRKVKRAFREHAQLEIVTKKPIVPTTSHQGFDLDHLTQVS